MPKVSVIITVYNCQKYIREAIDSILNQTLKDLELIVVDDGSTDKTGEILGTYKDPRIKVITQPNMGMAQGRNKGLEEARGEYIAIMDADDISFPERLEVLVDYLEYNSDIGGVSTDVSLANEHGEVTGVRHGIDSEEILNGPTCPCEPAYMIRKDLITKIGGYRKELMLASDYDLYLRLAEVSLLKNIDRPLYKYRINLTNDTTTRREVQYKYGKLAEKLAVERRLNGKDTLEISGEEGLNSILEQITLENVEREKLDGYYFYGKRFYNADDYKSAFKFLIRLFPADLFNKETVILMFKVIIKLTFPKKILLNLKRLKDKWKAPHKDLVRQVEQ